MPSNYIGQHGTGLALTIDPVNDSQLYRGLWTGTGTWTPAFTLRSSTANNNNIQVFITISGPTAFNPFPGWNNSNNKVECLGRGSGPGQSSLPGPNSASGGGGGAYAWNTNVTPTWPASFGIGNAPPSGNTGSTTAMGVSAQSGGAGGTNISNPAAGTAVSPQGYPGGAGVTAGGGGGGSAGPSGAGGNASGTTGGTGNGGTIASNSASVIWSIPGFATYSLGGGANGVSGTAVPGPAPGLGAGAGGPSWPSGSGPQGGTNFASGGIIVITYLPLPPKLQQRVAICA